MWHKDFMEGYFRVRQAKLLNHFQHNRTKMLTLTYWTKLYTPEQVAKRHKADLKRFVRLVREKYPDFQYAYFIELTENLYVHFHMYIDLWIPVTWLKDRWEEVTGSYIVWINYMESEKQKYYCANYHSIARKFNQEQLKFAFKHVSRFFGQSRCFFEKQEKAESNFNYLGRLISVGVDFREYYNLTDINTNIMMDLDELLESIGDVFFTLLKMDNGTFRIFGHEEKDTSEPPF